MAMLARSAHGELLVGLSRAQVRPVPDGLASKLVTAGRFGGLAVRSTADCPFAGAGSDLRIRLVVPNDYIEQFSELPSPALDDWVAREVSGPLSRGYPIDSIQLGVTPLAAEYAARFGDSLPAASKNLAERVNPLGVGVTVSVGLDDLSASYPPSAGRFGIDAAPVLERTLPSAAGLSLDAYPFLLALGATDPATVAFLALEPTAQGFWDDGGGLWYADALSSVHDAAVYALEGLGFGDLPVSLTTGWPTDGAAGATARRTATFLEGAARWTAGGEGSPKRPGANMSLVFRELLDEDTAELTEDAPWSRRWGIYDSAASSKLNVSAVGTYALVPGVDYETVDRTFCVVRSEAPDDALLSGLSFACNATDCTSIQKDASCYSPPSLRRHATIAYNGFFQDRGQDASACDFGGTKVARPEQPREACGIPTPASARATTVASATGHPITASRVAKTRPVEGHAGVPTPQQSERDEGCDTRTT
ncbi:O-Glycosyl hydrolases family 17 protein [Klebsormidium nitens]|uniref:O-Glycosyl hydrolases family 17 protein n=1 Tax=Klebsormidium nitens TaxID=105231 RepID=A0A1Y1IMB9_KLENI|nr:O-Glycosyl hydrolases family 17 protein [Klebsormidium nitens]|eukprot:GAQ92035.1 O-Glycosyl hydrolases family 17 protein [Klebsormidium nitens]